MAQINGSCSLGRNYGFYITVDVSGSYPNATVSVRSYVVNGDKRFDSNNWWFECTVNGVTKRSGRGINIASRYTDYWAACGPLTYGTDGGSGTSTVFTFTGVAGGRIPVSYRIYKSSSYSSYDPGEMTASGYIDVGYEQRNVVVRISEQDCYGNYGASWVWINTNVNYGSAVDYWGYGNASGPDNIYYNPVHYANSSVTSNIDTTVYASRRSYGFDLNIYDPAGNQPWDTGAAGYVDFSTDGGSTWTRLCNENAGSYPISRPLRIGTIYPGTGMHLNRVTAKNADTGAETTLTPSSGMYAYDQPANTLHLNVYMSWNTYTIAYNANGGTGAPGNQTKTYGTNLTLSSTKPTRANSTATGYTVTFNGNGGTPSKTSQAATNTISYTFNNWKDGAGTTYAAGGTYTKNQADTLTAQWNTSTSKGAVTTATASRSNGSSTRKVTFNANGGTCSTASLNSTATVTYSCTGWFTAASGGTKRANSGGSYTPSASETVYAQWSSTTGSYSAVTLPTATECTRQGYKLLGFATSNTATTAAYAPGASYTPSAAVTLYAVWELDQASIKIKVSGSWVQGKVWIKQNGTWVKAKGVYIKQSGTWKKGS